MQRLQAVWVLAARFVADGAWAGLVTLDGKAVASQAKLVVSLHFVSGSIVVLGRYLSGLHRIALSPSVARPF
ncbi:MAG TPA: hypothetical protein ENI75_04760 [Mizugakiibacter sp.]|nr:hypothetical protein [Mizugakiibacter sp.]